MLPRKYLSDPLVSIVQSESQLNPYFSNEEKPSYKTGLHSPTLHYTTTPATHNNRLHHAIKHYKSLRQPKIRNTTVHYTALHHTVQCYV